MQIYFQARINDVHAASGFCDQINGYSMPNSMKSNICEEVRFITGSSHIAMSYPGLKVTICSTEQDIVDDGIIYQFGESYTAEQLHGWIKQEQGL